MFIGEEWQIGKFDPTPPYSFTGIALFAYSWRHMVCRMQKRKIMTLMRRLCLARIRVFVAALLIAFFITSCDSQSGDEMMPMKAGYQWRYAVDGDVPNKVIAVEIVGRYVDDGVEWFHIEGFLDDYLMLANTSDGVYHTSDCDYDNFEYCAPENSPLTQEPLYKLSAEKGEHYGFLDWPDTAVTVLGEKEVTVPAGQFTCTMYEFKFDTDIVRHCVTPGVGVVRIEETWYGDKPVILSLIDKSYTQRGIDELWAK